MLQAGKYLAAGLLVLFASYVGYLGWRIINQRAKAPAAVSAILANADPAVDAISEERIAALLRVEDPTFWENNGIDHATPGAGMTTLAQGLGKRIFFEDFKPGFAKIELMVLTRFVLVDVVPKRDILRAVLAYAYLGHVNGAPVNGFAEGAQVYFDKSLSELSDREFLSLVAMLTAPNALDPAEHPAENAERVARIERLLAGACEPSGLRDVMLEGCAQ